MPLIDSTATVKFISKKPLSKPERFDFLTVGGFILTLPDGRDITFDWGNSSSNFTIDEKGYAVTETNLYNFDKDYFKKMNPEIHPETLTLRQLVRSTIKEIFCDIGYEVNGKEEYTEMDLVSFTLNSSSEPFQIFSQKQIVEYNKNNNQY